MICITDELSREHRAASSHPERPERYDAALAGVRSPEFDGAIRWVQPRMATETEISRVHQPPVLAAIREAASAGGAMLDPDTFVSPSSADAAVAAAGAGLTAVTELRDDPGGSRTALCIVRPPGHHATADRSMGFCLLNNVAITAQALVDAGDTVAIVDFDAHHGNGTQDIFVASPEVLFVSWHESPQYPGTGAVTEVGEGEGRGYTLNLPVPPGTRGDTYERTFGDVVGPVMDEFAPDWLLISAGFDAHRRDPLCSLGLTDGDFGSLTRRLLDVTGDSRVVAFLEGGYDLTALRTGVRSLVGAMVDADIDPEEASTNGHDPSIADGLTASVHSARRFL